MAHRGRRPPRFRQAMRAFVTGAAGFAGSFLAERLLASDREVFGLVRDRRRAPNLARALAGARAASLRLVEGDLEDGAGLRDTVRDIRPDEVYHLAAQSSVRLSIEDPAATFRANVGGTRAVLEAVAAAGSSPRVLVVGSAEAYGESARRGRPVEETDPLVPASPYGSSKAAAEAIALRLGEIHGLRVVRVRPFPHTGPRHAGRFVYSDLARQICEIRAGRRAARIQAGHLDVRRDLSDVRDVVAAYVLALERGEPGGVYNVCSGRSATVREVLQTMLALAEVEAEVVVRADRLRPHDLDTLVGTGSALRARTGWAPRTPPQTTLRDLLDYWGHALEPGARPSV